MDAGKPHCVCMSGLTEKQAVLLELGGLLEAVEWKVGQVRMAHELDDKATADYMVKVGLGLARLKEFCRQRGWRP